MYQTAGEIGAQILIVSEPVKKTSDHWIVSTNSICAIGIKGAINVSDKVKGKDFTWIKIANSTVYSCYWTPNVTSFQKFEECIEDLERDVRLKEGDIIIASDFNAKAVEWGSSTTCRKGNILAESIACTDFLICNAGKNPTFVRGLSRSIIDVTFATPQSYLLRIGEYCPQNP